MHNISKFFVFIALFISSSGFSQPTGTPRFTSPLDIPLFLSANYGEYRSGHFHAGLDFKTKQVEGKNVFAVDSGYVYRIVVLLWSYGNAIYIKHPSGNVTVYGHLSKFNPAVAAWVKEQQYRTKSYTLDIFPDSSLFFFKKGELIGLSGNSGGSFGAHLHFEVRDKTGAIPLNPLKYGFNIADHTSPRINWLMLYPYTSESYINGFSQQLPLQLRRKNNAYTISPDTVIVKGKFGLGIETYDFLDNSLNECAPSSIEMIIDEKQVFYSIMDSIPFSDGAYINSFFDYAEVLKSGKKIQKLFIDPNNKLNIYKTALNRGVVEFEDTVVHQVNIEVKDSYGNKSDLFFHLRSTKVNYPPKKDSGDSLVVAHFAYDSANVYETSDIRVAIPANALFDNLNFTCSSYETDSAKYSLMHNVHNRFTPLLQPYVLSIKTRNVPRNLHSKCLIVSVRAGNTISAEGGEYKNGFVTTKTRNFGKFMIAVDTVAPKIKPLKFNPGAKYNAGQTITFSIADTLSGISKYNGYIDNEWALFEYDAKNNLYSYTIDRDRLKKNQLHQLEIIVTDDKENISRYKNNFYY